MQRVIVGVFAVTLSALGAASASARLPTVLTQQRPAFQVRPAVIGYTGDGTGIVGGRNGTSARHLGSLHWTTYNASSGWATGLVWLDDCSPDCANGTFTSSRVSVHVFSPSGRHFKRLTLRYRYLGRRYTDRREARYYAGSNGIAGFWAYAICGTRYTGRC